MYRNMERMIELRYEIVITDVRYGNGFYIAFDSDDLNYKPFAELFEGTSGSDEISIAYTHTLELIESKYPAYPVIWANNLTEGFEKINEKAGKWLTGYTTYDQMIILRDIETVVKELEKRWI